ncbi:MAG: hypothetical protein CVU87_08235 [Firmicutes bacterium HGW-Firmicutes-12]|jgi:hypothetical protein|nr:MAG: hypothetical protein CVU87_08235 [Firmicutes bacterium HGW-Firmicutes-12]
MVDMPLYFIYFLYTGVLSIIAVFLVPKSDLKKLALYSIFFGGVYDILWILLIGLFGIGGYLNYGPLGFLKIPLLPPIAWTVFFIMYLYLLPEETLWSYFLAIIGALYSTFFSNALQNLGIFEWSHGRIVIPTIIYLTWFLSVTFIYRRYILKNIKE